VIRLLKFHTGVVQYGLQVNVFFYGCYNGQQLTTNNCANATKKLCVSNTITVFIARCNFDD
jgi:hypothetical protein